MQTRFVTVEVINRNPPLPRAEQRVGLSQYEVADLMGITRTRVHQIEKRALKKLRAAIEAEAVAAGISVEEWFLLGETQDA
jgi:hypothetical protein